MPLTCPKCGWSKTRKSVKSGFLDHAMRVFFLTPFRCRTCRLRFFRLQLNSNG